MGFQCIRQVPWKVLKNAASDLGFQHLPRDLRMLMYEKPCLIPILFYRDCCAQANIIQDRTIHLYLFCLSFTTHSLTRTHMDSEDFWSDCKRTRSIVFSLDTYFRNDQLQVGMSRYMHVLYHMFFLEASLVCQRTCIRASMNQTIHCKSYGSRAVWHFVSWFMISKYQRKITHHRIASFKILQLEGLASRMVLVELLDAPFFSC